MPYQVLLFYRYVGVADPEGEREAQRQICAQQGLLGRIIVGAEGINATVAGPKAAVDAYRRYMDGHPLFSGIDYKVDDASTLPFKKLIVKVRDEIVTLGTETDIANTATHLTPAQFNEFIKDPDVVLFDARNNYESAIGRFKGAITPDITLFKDLPESLDQYEDLKDKKIVTYCTGGIRCEKASALMKSRGFKDVYQLDGGIVTYAKQFPEGAFEGECYVFDERIKVGFTDNPDLLGSCIVCAEATNDYYNCANKSCNKQILICSQCSPRAKTCSQPCARLIMAAA